MRPSGLVSAVVAALVVLASSPPIALGQTLVRESARAWEAARSLRLVREQRWCDDAAADGCDLADITDALALPDGGILAINFSGPIHRFARSAAFVGAIGRRGAGPGEYRYVIAPALLPSGELAWYDQSLRRVATISLSQRPGAVTPLRPPLTMASAYVANGTLVTLDVPPVARPGDTVLASYRAIISGDSSRVLAQVRTPSRFVGGGGPMQSPPPLFAPTTVAHAGWAGDIAHSNGGEYVVHVFPASGRAWTLSVALPTRAVTAAERDSAVSEVLAEFKAASASALPPPFRSRVEDARRTMPALQDVRVLRDGTIWIRPTPRRGDTAARWDVFTRDGRRIGQARLPFAATIRDGARDWIITVERTADALPVVVRYAVRG